MMCKKDLVLFLFLHRTYQGSGKPENSQSGPKIRILDWFQTPQNANNSVRALNPIFSPTNQFSGINDVLKITNGQVFPNW